jgi:hypothetical protein
LHHVGSLYILSKLSLLYLKLWQPCGWKSKTSTMLSCVFVCVVSDVSIVRDASVFKARQFKKKIVWLVFMVDGHNVPNDVVSRHRRYESLGRNYMCVALIIYWLFFQKSSYRQVISGNVDVNNVYLRSALFWGSKQHIMVIPYRHSGTKYLICQYL